MKKSMKIVLLILCVAALVLQIADLVETIAEIVCINGGKENDQNNEN